MGINLKTKIWLTIFTIVLMFSFFTLFYFPRQEGNLLVNDYNTEVQNLANTVALGVNIALTEQNFEGVQTAIEYVKKDPRLQFVSMVQFDTSWNKTHSDFTIKRSVFKTYPEKEHPVPGMLSNDSVIVKRAPFTTDVMSGAIMLGFNTKEIAGSQQRIKTASLIVSSIIFIIGILIGLVLARNISVPVLALRDAANRVGEGHFDQELKNLPNDEIGELGKAFNKMVSDLSATRKELNEKNLQLTSTVQTLNNTLVELQNTHALLIQSEKMASLGELTAGIAHEIQNPLNFVNNFSDINAELIDELNIERLKPPAERDEELENEILTNIKENAEKINHHGKRADSIVKGMLQHSRKSSGQKEPTDINNLADEFLRLSYQGLRAKDKSFNARLQTDFDKTIGKINIVPQDIGRVLLNLFNNAFYAVNEQKSSNPISYDPTVSVATKKSENLIIITVSDNGNGVSQKIIDKIFQPFFTTKPTGEGTGLGLSLSYDIVKAHGGEIKVISKEGEGTEFIIVLPIT